MSPSRGVNSPHGYCSTPRPATIEKLDRSIRCVGEPSIVARLAGDLGVDDVLIGRWARGDSPSLKRRSLCVSRESGRRGSFPGGLYARDVERIRYRIRNQLPPL